MTSKKINKYIICGTDRLGKSSLISNLKNKLGFHEVIHFGKPEKLQYYVDRYPSAEFHYQYNSFINAFKLLGSDVSIIFDRLHLGEYVYSPRYRGYDGSYVFDLEQEFNLEFNYSVKLILLTTSDWSFIQDDGESFDFARKDEEQLDFIQAFNYSVIPNKQIINVCDGAGQFKNSIDILNEVISDG